jgi:hypothetical protein
MTDIDIFSTLNYQLQQFLTAHPIDVQYPNVAYVPQIGTDYIKVDLLPAETRQSDLGSGFRNRHTGIYQILIFTQTGSGSVSSKTIIDNLRTYFATATAISYNGVDIRISKFQINNYMEDADWFIQPVSIYYRSDIEN